MEPVTVYSKEELSTLWNIVKDRFPSQTVWMQRSRDGEYTLAIKKQYISEFCKIFSGWIHRKFCKRELEKILLEYSVLSDEEQNEILGSAMDTAKENQDVMADILVQKTKNLLEVSPSIKLEGFLQFCMQEYREKLEEITEGCLEHYFTEQDYWEFLDLLRYFIEMEEYGFGHLFVVTQPDGSYRYYDEKLQNITRLCMERFLLEFDDNEADADDCLITILILLLPERISLYGAEYITNQKFLNTLQNIFETRLKVHSGRDIFSK